MAKMITLSAYDCVEVDGYLYFFSLDYNFFFKMEISTGAISIVDSIPEESPIAKQLATKIIRYGDYLYFAPVNAKKIWRYSLISGEWKGYELKKIEGYEGKQAFYQAVLYNEKIYFFGSRYPAIVVFDLKNEETQYIEKPYKDKLKVYLEKNKDVFFIKNIVQIDNCVYMASCLDNSVLKFDLDTYEYLYLYVGDADMRYSGIGYDGTNFYLTPRKKTDAVKWDGARESEYIKLNYLIPNDERINIGALCKGDNVTFYGNLTNKKFTVDKAQTGNIDVQLEYWFYEKLGSDIYVSLRNDGNITITESDVERNYILLLEEDTIADYVGSKFQNMGDSSKNAVDFENNELLIENDLVSLKLFTKLI